MSRYLAIHALALIGALACSSVANAIPVTPGGYENVEGASDNCIPFTCRGVTRYQQIYDAAGFGGASGVAGGDVARASPSGRSCRRRGARRGGRSTRRAWDLGGRGFCAAELIHML